MNKDKANSIVFENVWQKNVFEKKEIELIWKQFNPSMEENEVDQRLKQICFLVKNEFYQVVGLSTAYKSYIKQLKNYLYAVRILIIPTHRIPGLLSKLLVETRDYLEEIHKEETIDPCIGVITLVENERLKKFRNEAIWPASKMVYIGNSKKGHHIRVYYFKGSLINE